MSQLGLTSESGAVFGPFVTIEQTTVNFYGDGIIYPKAVVGEAAVIGPWQPPAPLPLSPLPVPETITRLQLILGMTSAGLISPAEGVAAASGTAIPAVVEAVFASLPASQATAARIRWNAMTVVERASPLVAAVAAGATPPKTDAEMDQYFRDWSVL